MEAMKNQAGSAFAPLRESTTRTWEKAVRAGVYMGFLVLMATCGKGRVNELQRIVVAKGTVLVAGTTDSIAGAQATATLTALPPTYVLGDVEDEVEEGEGDKGKHDVSPDRPSSRRPRSEAKRDNGEEKGKKEGQVVASPVGSTMRALSDDEGVYRLLLKFPGTWQIRVEKDGFSFADRTIQVEQGEKRHGIKEVHLVPLDTKVTPVGPEGGVAEDSTGSVAVDVPPGAVSGTINVRLTKLRKIEYLPAEMPDPDFAGCHGVLLEPRGTVFSAPVKLRFRHLDQSEQHTYPPSGIASLLYNSETNQWEQLPKTLKLIEGSEWEETEITHFSAFT